MFIFKRVVNVKFKNAFMHELPVLYKKEHKFASYNEGQCQSYLVNYIQSAGLWEVLKQTIYIYYTEFIRNRKAYESQRQEWLDFLKRIRGK